MDLRSMAMAHVAARGLHVAVELGLPDHLAGGPLSAADLAELTATEASALRRLLTFLGAHDLVREGTDGRFALTEHGEALVTGDRRGLAGAVRAMGADAMWKATGDLLQAVRSGQPTLARDRPLYGARTPVEATYLSDTMLGFHGHEPPGIVAAYPWSSRSCVVDVGGSTGNLLATILLACPTLRGILFDLPAMAVPADAHLRAAGVQDRCSIVSGSFFDDIPAGGDTYVLSHVLHDWPEDDASTILSRCRAAMSAGDELLIVEELSAPDGPSAATLDLILLTTTGGRSRTAQDYEAMLAGAGLKLEETVPAGALVSLLRASVSLSSDPEGRARLVSRRGCWVKPAR